MILARSDEWGPLDGVVVCCDTCSAEEEIEDGDAFAVGWEALKARGWRAYRVRDLWRTACPDCGARERRVNLRGIRGGV